MSRISYSKTASYDRRPLEHLSLSDFIHALPTVTIDEIEKLAETNIHLVEQIPRYLSQMVSHEDSDGNKVTDIRLLREDSDIGALLILREFENTRYVDAFWTNLHVSEAIGAGGESDLADFFVTLRALYKSFVKLDVNVKGYLMPRSAYKQIREEEQAYPLMLLKDYRVNESMWWEDIWDKSQRGKFNYWKGDEALIRRIEDAIKRNKRLLDEIEAIKNSDPLDHDD